MNYKNWVYLVEFVDSTKTAKTITLGFSWDQWEQFKGCYPEKKTLPLYSSFKLWDTTATDEVLPVFAAETWMKKIDQRNPRIIFQIDDDESVEPFRGREGEHFWLEAEVAAGA